MTKYQREGDWLVEVAREKPIEGEPEFFGDETYLKYCYDMEDYERHLFSLKRLRISPELAAHLGDRMEVTSEEIELREGSVHKGVVYPYPSVNASDPSVALAYPKLIDGEEDCWNELNRVTEAMTGNKFQKWELDTLSKMFHLKKIDR